MIESRDFAAEEELNYLPTYKSPREAGYLAMGGIWCRSELNGLICTRERGHEGDHAAHGPDKEMLATWGTVAA